MTITMEGNFFDDDTRETVYIPTLVDSSIPIILAHRGVPATRIVQLIADLDSPCPMAAVEMETLLPCIPMHTMTMYEHHFSVTLERGVTWTGTDLTMFRTLPDTLIETLVGRTLREVVDHPALPVRIIRAVEAKDGGRTIKVDGDPRPVVELSGASDLVLAGSPMRNRLRRKWIDDQSQAGRCESDWTWWIDDNRNKAVDDFNAGKVRVHEEHCWGCLMPTPEPLIMLAAKRTSTGWRRMSDWLRTPTRIAA